WTGNRTRFGSSREAQQGRAAVSKTEALTLKDEPIHLVRGRVEGSNPSGPAIKLQRNRSLMTFASTREVLSTQRRDLCLISRHAWLSLVCFRLMVNPID